MHALATEAAIASECARALGRFQEMHDLLFSQRGSIGTTPWTSFARQAGITDTTAFIKCTASDEAAAIIARDSAAGEELDVRGTPTFLVNEVLVPGFPGKPIMDSVVLSVLMRAKESAVGAN